MKKLKIIFLSLLGVLTLVSCKREKSKSTTEQPEIVDTVKVETTSPEAPKIGFQRTLTMKNISFDLKTTGERSIIQLVIQPKGLEIDNQQIKLEVDGQVVNAEIGDLNSDGFPELLIYTVSAGSGSYGIVIGYSVNNGKSVSQITFPDLSENKKASSGYMGHDEFSIVNNNLVRKFPIYKDTDTNSNPSGGTREINYILKNAEASRVFVIYKIKN